VQTYALLGNAITLISILKRLLRLTVGAAITIRNDHRFQELAEKRNLERERTHTGRVVSCW
jgi:hypothetical protein